MQKMSIYQEENFKLNNKKHFSRLGNFLLSLSQFDQMSLQLTNSTQHAQVN